MLPWLRVRAVTQRRALAARKRREHRSAVLAHEGVVDTAAADSHAEACCLLFAISSAMVLERMSCKLSMCVCEWVFSSISARGRLGKLKALKLNVRPLYCPQRCGLRCKTCNSHCMRPRGADTVEILHAPVTRRGAHLPTRICSCYVCCCEPMRE